MLTRYNPFSLSIFSQWYADDRKLTVADIRAGKDDRYVELRIVGRIKQEDRRLLPAVVLLRRFDARMLALGFTGSPGDFEASFRALSDHEWLNYRRDPQTDEIWLEVDPNFYPRLRAYFDKVERAALDSARRALGQLAESVRSPGRSGRASEEIAAALALLPDAEAAQLWSEVEWRVPEEADWSWGLRVTGLALAAEADAVPGSRPLVFAALSATQAAANIHLSPTYNPAEAWRDVAAALAQLTARGSAAPLARWLAARAALGQTAAAGVNTIRTLLAERAAGAGRLGSLPSYLGAQLDAALLAALEKLVDVAEETSDRSLLGAALDLDLDTFAKALS